MHISLDSALGRQRRLNSVGESVLQIAPNAAAAYSLRSLTGGDPDVVRVRIGGTTTEKTFTASGVSSGALVDFVGSGNDGFVTIWYDQSGNSNNAVQPSAGSQPKIVNAGSLISDGIEFDGTNDVMGFTSNVISNVNSASLFVVAKSTHPTGATIQNGILISNTPVYSSPLLLFGVFYLNYGSSNINMGAFDNNVNLFSSVTGSTHAVGYELIEAFRNGVSKGTVSALTGFSSPGSFGFGSGNYQGKFQEVIIYDSDQNLNRAAIESNINNHYSIF